MAESAAKGQEETQSAPTSDEKDVTRVNMSPVEASPRQAKAPIGSTICRFFLMNRCANSACPYLHDMEVKAREDKRKYRTKYCRFFMIDACSKGDSCDYIHGKPMMQVPQIINYSPQHTPPVVLPGQAIAVNPGQPALSPQPGLQMVMSPTAMSANPYQNAMTVPQVDNTVQQGGQPLPQQQASHSGAAVASEVAAPEVKTSAEENADPVAQQPKPLAVAVPDPQVMMYYPHQMMLTTLSNGMMQPVPKLQSPPTKHYSFKKQFCKFYIEDPKSCSRGKQCTFKHGDETPEELIPSPEVIERLKQDAARKRQKAIMKSTHQISPQQALSPHHQMGYPNPFGHYYPQSPVFPPGDGNQPLNPGPVLMPNSRFMPFSPREASFSPMSKECSFYKKGHCKKGSLCPYLHNVELTPTSGDSDLKQEEDGAEEKKDIAEESKDVPTSQ